jgi:hypothetical protein
MTVLKWGDTAAREVSKRIATPVASISALAAIGIADASDGQLAHDIGTGNIWRFSAACALTGDNLLVAGSGTGNGRWLLTPGARQLVMPITFATADAAVLCTVPTGCVFMAEEFYWKITADWTGGSSSAIGLSSSKTGYSTKGDLLGGASGNVLADLTTALSPTLGTIGAGFDTLAKRRKLWVAADTIRFDRITSVFTAGAGSAVAKITLLANPGA